MKNFFSMVFKLIVKSLIKLFIFIATYIVLNVIFYSISTFFWGHIPSATEKILLVLSLLLSLIITFWHELIALGIRTISVVKAKMSKNSTESIDNTIWQKLKKELVILCVCIIVAIICITIFDKMNNLSHPQSSFSVNRDVPQDIEKVLHETLDSNAQALAKFEKELDETNIWFEEGVAEKGLVIDDTFLTPETKAWLENGTETKGVNIKGFREKIGSFGFIKDYLIAWKDGVRHEYVKQIVDEYAGHSCEMGLEAAEKSYRTYCNTLEENLQNEIEALYGDKVNVNNQDNNSLVETHRQELESVFTNQQSELLGSVVGDTISIAFVPFAIDGLTSILAGTVAGGPIGWAFAIGSVAIDAYQFIVKRPAELDAIAGKLRDSVNEYQTSLHSKYRALAQANYDATSDIAKKIAENAKIKQ